MSQTITNCNAIPAGKTYPVEDLRTAESVEQLCDYVDAGHPIANQLGQAVKLFCRQSKEAFIWVAYCDEYAFMDTYAAYDSKVLGLIKLAPIAYRDGYPLHAGARLMVATSKNDETDWNYFTIGVQPECYIYDFEYFSKKENSPYWRFAND